MKTAKVKIRILVNVGVNMQDGYREFHAGDIVEAELQPVDRCGPLVYWVKGDDNGDIAFWADEAEVVECL